MVANGFKLEAVGDNADKASSAGEQSWTCSFFARRLCCLTQIDDAESTCSSERVAEFDTWNASADAYTFLYNPDPWQQGGAMRAIRIYIRVPAICNVHEMTILYA